MGADYIYRGKELEELTSYQLYLDMMKMGYGCMMQSFSVYSRYCPEEKWVQIYLMSDSDYFDNEGHPETVYGPSFRCEELGEFDEAELLLPGEQEEYENSECETIEEFLQGKGDGVYIERVYGIFEEWAAEKAAEEPIDFL